MDVQNSMMRQWGSRQFINAGIAALVLLGLYVFLDWEIFLLLGLIAAAIAITGLLSLLGVTGRARLPLIQLVLLVGAAFVLIDSGVWRWVFVASGVVFGLAVFSRRGSDL